jgi:predicted dehydrogenase
VHVLDLARFLMGDVRTVSAAAAAAGTAGESFAVTLAFATGAVGTVVTSATALSLHPWERVEVFGDGAWLEVEDQSTLTLHPGEYEPARVWSPVVPSTLVSAEEWGGYVGLLEDFLAAVRAGAPSGPRTWDGYRALELVEAVRRSAERGAAVPLPLAVDGPAS